ncbi:hypothetical protein BDZ94DRAFT_1317152 [Collybia nuda]|uniref:Uncharacterized protein n=1 Tax=Collybia nuda TaxID=64659 RepID=A0A9P5YFX1_9AGAR|nr:hypothetical protein BDZ94DRAFT_1317152 [Collybia nuda]
MPVPTFSRHNRTTSPPTISTFSTPARSKSTRGVSPPPTNTNYSPTIGLGGQQQRLNIVTRVAIEGKARQGQDGASIKMYLKISVPLDSVTPGTTIPLFPEENVKILTSQVHPIDSDSVPYNFSSTVSPLLHNAARALNLPARSMDAFDSVFDISPVSTTPVAGSSRISKPMSGSATSENIPPIDVQYTGHILVSGYHISYVLPKNFPSRHKVDGLTDNEGEGFTRSSSRGRRTSVGERNAAQFMAAIDMWVPYVSRPPRSPYLLSLPTPRCLHNNIKLRIFPPTVASSSFASLSSLEEDGGSWDLTSDPHVTRRASNRPSRSNSYTHFADDESSDSSTAGFSDGCGIQGTFPSAERIRIRWAKPLRSIGVGDGGTDDGRRRAGVKDVRGEMTCIIRGRGADQARDSYGGIIMDVEYKGTCKGVWFPGVATLLGMDVVLEAKGSEVSWVDGSPNEWVISGGVGYTGFNVGVPRQAGPESRTSSLDSNSLHNSIPSSSPQGQTFPASKQTSTSSTASLLRAPLPAQNVAEYSFEGSTATLASSSQIGTVSSMSSLMPASTNDSLNTTPRPPGTPVTLHINMNEIIPPAKNFFVFSISGTVIVTARPLLPKPNGQTSNSSLIHSGTHHENADPEPIVLPRFTVLAADSESTSISVRNEIGATPATVEVYNSTGDIYRDAQAKKTVLQKGGATKCIEGGGRIAYKSISSPYGHNRQPISLRAPTGHGLPRIPSNSSLGRMIYPSRPKRDGPLMIPSVVATITPFIQKHTGVAGVYAVRVSLNAPADADSEWLEFGLAKPGGTTTPPAGNETNLSTTIISASIEGVPVKFETTTPTRQDAMGLGVPFEELSNQEWVSWVKVHVGPVGGGVVVVEYIVNNRPEDSSRKSRARVTDGSLVHVFLPTFALPVGRLDVDIDTYSGMEIISLQSNFAYETPTPKGHKLLQYSLEEFFYPRLSLVICPKLVSKPPSLLNLLPLTLVTWAIILVGTIFALQLSAEMKRMTRSLESHSAVATSGWTDKPEPITVTTTIYTNAGTRRQFGDIPTETSPVPFLPTPIASIIATGVLPPDEDHPPDQTPLPVRVMKHATRSLPPSSSTESYALLPVQTILSFSWPFQEFDIRATLDKAFQAVEVIWQLLRRAYHYPLDPT